MINKGNRVKSQPIIIQNNKVKQLERVPLNQKLFSEGWIQKLIHENPNILPINDIESVFSPAFAIGREVSTPVGPIDNLFISREGYLTLVETKLWRNPEARREVVGQILDYAKELNKWSFNDLDSCVKSFNQRHNNNSNGLIETVQKDFEFEEEEKQIFIDNISKNLARGRFLLLIVGDGIRESVEDMIDYLSQSPQIHFTLALIELQVYKLSTDSDSLIVIPQLITRTREIIRAIVKIEGNKPADYKITVQADPGETGSNSGNHERPLTITEDDFYDQLEKNTDIKNVNIAKQLIKDSKYLGLDIKWNAGSFSLKLSDPKGSGENITIHNVDRRGQFYMGYGERQYLKLQLPLEIPYKYVEDTSQLLPGIKPSPIKPTSWDKYSSLNDLINVYPQFMKRLADFIDVIRNYETEKI